MSLLSESEIIGIKSAHLIGVGFFGLLQCDDKERCHVCERKQELNCDMLDQSGESVLYHEDVGGYQTCPQNYIPNNVNEFLGEYFWLEKYPSSAPKHCDSSPRYIEAMNVFEAFRNEFEKNNVGSDGTTENNMEKARSL